MPRPKGPKKVRIPGTNDWVTQDEYAALVVPPDVAAEPVVEPEADDLNPEWALSTVSELGERPEPTPKVPEPEYDIPHYYHAFMPNLWVKRGRRDALRWRGGVIRPRTPAQEARVRHALEKYVPGGNPDRWKGDTPGLDEDLRCHDESCGFFTRNINVWKDHGKKTGHFRV
jgi:hypothetical protein